MIWTCKNICHVSSFEHLNFAINGKYSKKIMIIQIIMYPLWFFKHTKMQFKKVFTHWVAPLIVFLPYFLEYHLGPNVNANNDNCEIKK
jgi:hypothetical protein